MQIADVLCKISDHMAPLVEITAFKDEKPVFCYHAISKAKEDMALKKGSPFGESFLETLSQNKTVKTILLKSEDDITIRIRLDVSMFTMMQEQLDSLLNTTKLKASEKTWNEQIDGFIRSYLQIHNTTLTLLNKKDKQKLINQLSAKGLLDYKEATQYIANKLNLSRATVYNYLKWSSTVKHIHIHQVDAFTQIPFDGNPAGVVSNASGLSDDLMRKISRELNLNETAFVLPSESHDFRFRYFTPSGDEVNFCGHSTVGALHVLSNQLDDDASKSFTVETNAGILNMRIDKDEDGESIYCFETPTVQMQKSNSSVDELAKTLNSNVGIIETNTPMMIENTNRTLFVPIATLKDLHSMEVDFKQIQSFLKLNDLLVLCCFTTETVSPKYDVHTRCFAPGVGIPEDPFTGSVLGGLAGTLQENHLLRKDQISFGVEQGHHIGRPGKVRVYIKSRGKKIYAEVKAHAVGLFSSEINLV